ncbi:MAG: hypothetical protein EOO65_05755, partial [Methanosarcinales archaeon]
MPEGAYRAPQSTCAQCCGPEARRAWAELGAFEQAGGLMNLYASEKTDRVIGFLNWTVPATWFQSVNSFFIITLGIPVAAFWFNWKKKGKEASSIFKIAMGVLIMGWGFLFMSAASMQYQENGSSAMYWLVLAYLFHT